jgi:hypothetical protein
VEFPGALEVVERPENLGEVLIECRVSSAGPDFATAVHRATPIADAVSTGKGNYSRITRDEAAGEASLAPAPTSFQL